MDKADSIYYYTSSNGVMDLDGLTIEGDDSAMPQAKWAAVESIIWRKLDAWILPLCTSFFLLAYLDRANIGNARSAGLQASLVISDDQYTMALIVGYIPFMVAELPAAWLLKYVGPNFMLPTMATLWGIVSASQGFVNNYSGLLACRFFLGLLEGGLFPAIIIYLSSFYPRKWLQLRAAVFFASSSLSGAFSGLLATAINQMDGKAGKPGWAWIFLLEGIFTCVFGVISFFLLPRSPEAAHFLTDKERAFLISALKHSGSVSEDGEEDTFSWIEVAKTARSPHVWLLSVMLFFSGTILFGLPYFEPTIVLGLGYAGDRAQLLSVPPFVATFIVSLITAVVSDRYQCRGFTVIFCSLMQLIGFAMFYASTSNYVRYASLFFSISGAYSTVPALITWVANNSAPHVGRATAVAACSILSQAGGVLATWLLGSQSPAPNYTEATITFIVMSILIAILSAINVVYLWRENQSKEETRDRTVKEEEQVGLGDRSAWFVYSL